MIMSYLIINTYVKYTNLKKMERYLQVNLLGPDPRLIKKEFTGPRSHKVWETLLFMDELHYRLYTMRASETENFSLFSGTDKALVHNTKIRRRVQLYCPSFLISTLFGESGHPHEPAAPHIH
jgi:hypothetical protein